MGKQRGSSEECFPWWSEVRFLDCFLLPLPSPPMPTSVETLRASLERHNATFESLLKLIPARYYLIQEESEEQVRPYHHPAGRSMLTLFSPSISCGTSLQFSLP